MLSLFFFFFNDTATTEIYTLSLHDALPISEAEATNRIIMLSRLLGAPVLIVHVSSPEATNTIRAAQTRSEEHTSELQSQSNLVCRLLLEKKKKMNVIYCD